MTIRVSRAVEERAKAIAAHLPKSGCMVEVGVLLGHLSWAVRQRFPEVQITMVDNWLPMYEQPKSYIATRDDHALHSLKQAQSNEARARLTAEHIKAQVLKGNSTEVAAQWGLGPQDLIFIDADHSYEGCKADIEAWRVHVRPGGWLGGHDYQNPDPRFSGVDRAVSEAFPSGVEVGENYTWWVQL